MISSSSILETQLNRSGAIEILLSYLAQRTAPAFKFQADQIFHSPLDELCVVRQKRLFQGHQILMD